MDTTSGGKAKQPSIARNAPQFESRGLWSAARPKTMVIACSDGRLQACTDEFLQQYLDVHDYDRLYIPGGAGAMAFGGSEFIRADTHRRAFSFLLQAHGPKQVILLTHSAADDGPPESVCAHYRRVFTRASVAEIREQQSRDIADVSRALAQDLRGIKVRAFRADVTAAFHVSFTEITPP